MGSTTILIIFKS